MLRHFRAALLAGSPVVVAGVVAASLLTSQAAGASASTPVSGSDSTSATRVLTIGDSIMSGHGLEASQAWPALLASEDNISVDNVACSGAGFIAVGSCGTNFAGLVAQASNDDPQVVLIESSDNDQGDSDVDIQAATSRTIDAIHKAWPNAEIVGFNTLWDQPGAFPHEVSSSSNALKVSLHSVGGKYIDIGQPIRGQADLLQSDSEHPTVAGQEVLASTIRQALKDNGITV